METFSKSGGGAVPANNDIKSASPWRCMNLIQYIFSRWYWLAHFFWCMIQPSSVDWISPSTLAKKAAGTWSLKALRQALKAPHTFWTFSLVQRMSESKLRWIGFQNGWMNLILFFDRGSRSFRPHGLRIFGAKFSKSARILSKRRDTVSGVFWRAGAHGSAFDTLQ